MKDIIKYIKRLFGKYETGYEYRVYIKQIKVNPDWRKTRIGNIKFKRKLRHWYRTGEFESRIILNKEYNLLDGYSSLRIAKLKVLIGFLCTL